MKGVVVRYTVKPEFAEENKANIRKVMEYLRANPIEGMQYASFVEKNDENSFVHINICNDEETLRKINDIEPFQVFRSALNASGPVVPPKGMPLEAVGAGYDI